MYYFRMRLSNSETEDSWRAALSALLDGEDPSAPVPSVVAHLDDCLSCAAWLASASGLNARLRTLGDLHPQLGERVVNAVDVELCGCHVGEPCLCSDCQCGPHCACCD